MTFLWINQEVSQSVFVCFLGSTALFIIWMLILDELKTGRNGMGQSRVLLSLVLVSTYETTIGRQFCLLDPGG